MPIAISNHIDQVKQAIGFLDQIRRINGDGLGVSYDIIQRCNL